MNRRQVLLGLGGVGITAGSAWVATQDFKTETTAGFPIRIETLDARGSTAGHTRIPVADTVTVIDLFATWCAPCEKQMDALSTIHGEYGDDVAFVSITNERIGGSFSAADIREWWRHNDGAWTLGYDPKSRVMAALAASGLPYIAIAAADGTLTWKHAGVASVGTLRERIDAALNA